ncbi:dTDP-4-dehydrorhamnose reductase [Rhodophyticola sp. CCM32]|uniref:dTDP-4-dehydrorhamnose reductase n=1 Tax=Rhodophyticola sp. CCM32 TaxID=2916397 RepID=UPI00107FCF4B|nr:dTDP-4-dehydrorhamnose reductase [Rhodophyticola sp. CCM32]QBY01993.1 dTDP-4-dehydrorhamnose reductase [Rhodophyticola sp. CCM32]
MTVLVFGATGQVGNALADLPDVIALGRAEADLSMPETCRAAIKTAMPDLVINAAAFTDVDGAEAEEELAQIINAEAPAAMAQSCAALNIPLVHISTDYVFDGSGQAPRKPDAPTGPLGAYGRSKLAGEEALRAAGGPHAILRTSWVFDGSGKNFVTTMLRLGAARDRLSIVADQIGGPTPADALAKACMQIGQHLCETPGDSGTYHFAGQPDVSWAGFARTIFQTAGLACVVEDIATSAYPTPAKRPLNSRLDCRRMNAVFGLSRPDWRAHLAAYLSSVKGP